MLWELEEGLRRQVVPARALRAAYYFSDWDGLLASARDTGRLPTVSSPGLAIPIVAPADLGRVAARMLRQAPKAPRDLEIRYVEEPRPLASVDVAQALGEALGRAVSADASPIRGWEPAFREMEFSEAASDYAHRLPLN